MELTREARDETASAPLRSTGTGVGGGGSAGAGHPDGIGAEDATLLLRRCTALAARARVDLLSPGRCEAADELVELLAQMSRWDPESMGRPDPTMTVLAAAALQDLAERLHLAAPQQESSLSALPTSIDAALPVLQEFMAGGRVDVPA